MAKTDIVLSAATSNRSGQQSEEQGNPEIGEYGQPATLFVSGDVPEME